MGHNNNRYLLTFSGTVLPGYDLIQVCAKLTGLFRLSPALIKLATTGEQIILRYDLTKEQAVQYQEKLKKLGAVVSYNTVAEPTLQLDDQDELDLLSSLLNKTAATKDNPTELPPAFSSPTAPKLTAIELEPLDHLDEFEMQCPACGHRQPKRTLCLNCAADMPRMLAAQEQTTQGIPVSYPPDREPHKFKHDNFKRNHPEQNHDHFINADEPPIWGIGLSGRMGRCRYAAGMWALIGAAVLAGILVVFISLIMPLFMVIFLIIFTLFNLFFTNRLIVLRLHDLNRSGWWIVLFFIIVGIAGYIFVSDIMMSFTQLQANSIASLENLENIWGTALIYFSVMSIFMSAIYLTLLLWPGSEGENDFGYPPQQPSFILAALNFLMVALVVLAPFLQRT